MKPYRAKVGVMAAMAAGRRRVDAGDLQGAIGRFDAAVRLDPSAAQAYLYRAGLHLLRGDERAAARDFKTLEEIDHSFLPAYRDLTTLSAEEFPALIPASERLLRRHPGLAWAWVFHAFSHRSLMRYERAISYLDRAVRCRPDSAALYAMRSRVKLTNGGAPYEGVADMERAVALAPRWGWLRCWLGEALRHRGQLRRALAAHDLGLALDPRYKRGYAWRGGVKVALGLYDSAREDLDRALAFDPIYHYEFEYTADQKSWAYNQRQLADRGLGDMEAALSDLRQAHRHGPRYGWVYSARREPAAYAAGVAELDAALRRRPRLAWAWAWRGHTLLEAGRADEAEENLRRALSLSPGAAWPRAWLGRCLLSRGDAHGAARQLDAALRADPSYAPAWGWRGEARRLLGRPGPAAADFTRAIRLDHRAAWAYAGRGEARLAQGDARAALEDLDRALGILPSYAEALGWRAEARRRLGDARGALLDADAALAAKPGLVLVWVTRSLVRAALGDARGQVADMRRAARLDPALLAAAGGARG